MKEQLTKHPMQNSKLVAHYKLGCMSTHLVRQGTLALIPPEDSEAPSASPSCIINISSR